MTTRYCRRIAAALCSLLLATAAAAQPPDTAGPDKPAAPDVGWSVAATAMTYLIPDDSDYVSPTLTADHDHLHLEGRYNYEGLSTASVWVGYNFSAGETVTLEFTPMIGGVFGDITGVAPGYRASLGWRKLEFYSDSFLYTWTELTFAPVDWFRFGAVAQRTRAYESELDIQRGVLAGVSFRRMDLTAHVFNWGWTEPTWVFSVVVHF